MDIFNNNGKKNASALKNQKQKHFCNHIVLESFYVDSSYFKITILVALSEKSYTMPTIVNVASLT